MKIQLMRNSLVVQRKNGLNHSCRAGGCFEMADTCLDRTHDQGIVFMTIFSIDFSQRTEFNGIAECGSGSVRFHIPHISGRKLPVIKRLADDLLLGRAIGCGKAAACSVVIQRRASDNTKDIIPV